MIKHFQRKLRERIVLREKEEKEEGKREIRDCNHKQSEWKGFDADGKGKGRSSSIGIEKVI